VPDGYRYCKRCEASHGIIPSEIGPGYAIKDTYHSAQANGIVAQEDQDKGIKYDQDKLPYHLLPYDALDEVVKVLQHGAKKYSSRNWEQGIEYSRLYSAATRHAKDFFQYREQFDNDSGIHPIAHSICNLLFLLALDLRRHPLLKMTREIDDRPVNITKKNTYELEPSNPTKPEGKTPKV